MQRILYIVTPWMHEESTTTLFLYGKENCNKYVSADEKEKKNVRNRMELLFFSLNVHVAILCRYQLKTNRYCR